MTTYDCTDKVLKHYQVGVYSLPDLVSHGKVGSFPSLCPYLCPPPLTLTLRPAEVAALRAIDTSESDWGKTMRAGLPSQAPFISSFNVWNSCQIY